MFYIFLIAILNLALGFAAAVHLGRRYHSLAGATPALDPTVSAGDLADDQQDTTSKSTMGLGMDEDDDMLGEDEEDIESLLNGVAAETIEPAAEDSFDGDNDSGGTDGGDTEEGEEQPQDTESGDLDADLDKLFENIDI